MKKNNILKLESSQLFEILPEPENNRNFKISHCDDFFVYSQIDDFVRLYRSRASGTGSAMADTQALLFKKSARIDLYEKELLKNQIQQSYIIDELQNEQDLNQILLEKVDKQSDTISKLRERINMMNSTNVIKEQKEYNKLRIKMGALAQLRNKVSSFNDELEKKVNQCKMEQKINILQRENDLLKNEVSEKNEENSKLKSKIMELQKLIVTNSGSDEGETETSMLMKCE